MDTQLQGWRMEERRPWVIVRVGDCILAVDSIRVTEMVMLPSIATLVGAAPWVRGTALLRSHVVTVLDLRMLLGFCSLRQELDGIVRLLDEREQDHRNWLGELEASVREARTFSLTRDPHACAFGKWYDAFHAADPVLARHMRMMDVPHRAVHALAETVCAQVQRGEAEEALRLIERGRTGTLAKLIRLFALARELLQNNTREILVVQRGEDGALCGLAVDEVVGVEPIEPGSIEDAADIGLSVEHEIVAGLGKTVRDGRLVLLLGDTVSAASLERVIAAA